MNDSLAQYYRDAATEHALRPEAGQEDTLGLVIAALKRAEGWRVENPEDERPAEVVALLEQAKALSVPSAHARCRAAV